MEGLFEPDAPSDTAGCCLAGGSRFFNVCCIAIQHYTLHLVLTYPCRLSRLGARLRLPPILSLQCKSSVTLVSNLAWKSTKYKGIVWQVYSTFLCSCLFCSCLYHHLVGARSAAWSDLIAVTVSPRHAEIQDGLDFPTRAAHLLFVFRRPS